MPWPSAAIDKRREYTGGRSSPGFVQRIVADCDAGEQPLSLVEGKTADTNFSVTPNYSSNSLTPGFIWTGEE